MLQRQRPGFAVPSPFPSVLFFRYLRLSEISSVYFTSIPPVFFLNQ